MKEREKTYEPVQNNPLPGTSGDADALAVARAELDELLSAGDAAIDAALSKDSAAFLASTQQQGGE